MKVRIWDVGLGSRVQGKVVGSGLWLLSLGA